MASYVYRCRTCGPWELHLPMGTAQRTSPCPTCGVEGSRVYTPPLLSRTPRPVAAALAREEASRDAPAVTTAVPPRASRPARRDPRWAALPRP